MSSSVFASLTRGASFAKSKNRATNINLFKQEQEQSKSTTVDFKALTVFGAGNAAGAKIDAKMGVDVDADSTSDSEEEEEEEEDPKNLTIEGSSDSNGGSDSEKNFAASGSDSESDNNTKRKSGDAGNKTLGKHKASKFGEFKRQEDVNAFRNALQIKIRGDITDAPAPSSTFNGMNIHHGMKSVILDNIEKSAWKEPTPIQMQAIPALLAGRDLLAAAPTGSGKTAAFVIPALSIVSEVLQSIGGTSTKESSSGNKSNSNSNSGVKALLLAPTRELAEQIHREAVRLCAGRRMRITLLKKATNSSTQAKQDKSAFASYDVLVSTPLRLVTLLREGSLSLDHVRVVCLDEADKLFELKKHGHSAKYDGEEDMEEEDDGEGDGGKRTRSSFLAQVDEILAACPQKNVRRALFSATIGSFVAELAAQFLKNPVHVSIGTENTGASTIDQKLVFVGREDGKLLAVQQLVQQGLKPPVLLFVQSIDRAKELFKELAYDGINVDIIHAEKSQSAREETIKRFRSGEIWVLICTELMARGVDFKGVQMVINYDLPQSSVDYIHRIGRTGRAGKRGTAVTFFTEADIPRLRGIANVVKLSGCEVPPWMLTIPKLTTKQKRHLRQAAPLRRHIDTSIKPRPDKSASAGAGNAASKSREGGKGKRKIRGGGGVDDDRPSKKNKRA